MYIGRFIKCVCLSRNVLCMYVCMYVCCMYVCGMYVCMGDVTVFIYVHVPCSGLNRRLEVFVFVIYVCVERARKRESEKEIDRDFLQHYFGIEYK
jgi:hypothetical protein